MSPVAAILVLLAGVGAGAINAVVGSGSLITFPTLLALGYPPVLANVSNNIGMVPGGAAGTWGYRRELAGQGRRLLTLGSMSCLGGLTGALLLLVLPAAAFRAIVPALLAVSLVLVVLQPRIQRAMTDRHARQDRRSGVPAMAGVGLAGVYGGYFGGGQGVLLVGILGTLLPESIQRVNGVKNALAATVNTVAAVVFVVVAPDRIDWSVVALIAAGSAAGGLLGAGAGRRLHPAVLRAVIVTVGLVAIASLLRP